MPVRLGTAYTKNIRVRWTENGKPRSKAFRWPGPARKEVEWLRGIGRSDARLDVMNERQAFIEKELRRGISREHAEEYADAHGLR